MDSAPGTEASGLGSKPAVKRPISNVIKRLKSGTLMVSGFLLLIYSGPIAILCTAYTLQVLCLREILSFGYHKNKIPPSLPYFRSLCWYFILAANYFLSLETLPSHFQDVMKRSHYLQILIRYHRFISFCIYFSGIIIFVHSLVRKYELKQFKILAWTHTLMIIIVVQVYLTIENMFHGLIWLILPISLVILNDIFAYTFGRLYGSTPLIELSPGKTWEGFIGGALGTFLSGFILSQVLCRFRYFVCPIEYYGDGYLIKMKSDCTPSYVFTPTSLSVGPWISVNFYPFTYHFLALSLFTSIVAPFGGFCASGFKRALNTKNFADVIPGHGGIMDRFDCQFLMGTFVHVYIFTFVKNSSVDLIFERVLYLDETEQLQFYYALKDYLQGGGLGNMTVVN